MRKDRIKIINNEKYIHKKDSDFWINTFLLLSIAFFIVGLTVGHNMTINYANKELNKALEEIKQSKYYEYAKITTKKDIDYIIQTYKTNTTTK